MKKVVYIVEDEGSAQFRYRVLNVQESLEKSKEWRAEYVLKEEVLGGGSSRRLEGEDLGGEFLAKLEGAEILVIERQTAKDGKILEIIQKARERRVKVLFDLDDLVFDYRDLPILMKGTGSRNVFYWAGYVWGIRRIALEVDGFLTTNEFLAEKLRRSFKKPVRVIRNSLNRKQLEVSEKCLGKKNADGFWIGYFSGSPTHVKDFRMVEGELMRFLEKYEDAKLRIVGYMELSEKMKELEKAGKVEVLGFVDYLELQKLMSEVDVNIAPLVLNDFTNSKSELKFFEAAAVETTTIASPSFTFARAIEDGENGFLAEPEEWFLKLEYLYQHPAENRKIAKRARKDALENYYGEKFLREIEGALGDF